MTTYRSDLGAGQQVYIANQGTQTVVTLMSGGPGQQQSQSNGFETGEWQAPPVLFRAPAGLVLRVEGARGPSFIRLQSSGMTLLDAAPALAGANVLPLQPAAEQTASDMRPMEPMEPLKPMQPLKPMEMRMGDMHMRMGAPEPEPRAKPEPRPEPQQASEPQAAHARRFCTQCGKPTGATDRFCAYCGNRLAPAEA
jgi:hypothetical protein